MKRKTLSFLLAVLLLLTAFPLNVFADAKNYKIYIGGTQITSENAKDVFNDGTVSFDEKTYTLTLTGAKIEAALVDGDYYGIKSDETKDITVFVKETNLIKCKETADADVCGIFAKGNLTLTGENLNIICEKSKKGYGVVCGDKLLFKNATAEIDCVFASETGVGVYAVNSLAFDDSALRIFGSTQSIVSNGELSFLSGTYYMGGAEPSEKYPKGYEYLVTKKIRYFTVIWKNYDGTVLETDKNVKEGTVPQYNGKTPTRKSDENYTYTFKGWNKKIVPIQKDTEFKAVFTRKKIEKPADVEENEKIIDSTDTDKNDVVSSGFRPLMLRAVGKKKKIILKWKNYKNADGYIIYGAPCGKPIKKLKTIKNPEKVKYTFKKLKKGKYYRYLIVAYKNSGGRETVTATSKAVHCTTAGGRYGNPTKIKISAKEITLKKGKTKKLKPKMISKKTVDLHISEFRYESSDPSVASVSAKGKIKAKKKGTANIFIIAQNGKYRKVKVTVK